MEQEPSAIRLTFESDAFEVESGLVVVFPVKPSEEIMAQIRQGTFPVTPIAFVGSVAQDVPVYGSGYYSGSLGDVKVRVKKENRRWTADQVALPQFMISHEDIEKGEYRLVLPAVGTLKVTVVDNQGHLAAGRKVCVMEPGRSQCDETDAAGTFTVQLALGHYHVTVTDGEWRQVDLRESFGDVSLVLRQPGRSCRVMVVDKEGHSCPRCTLVRAIKQESTSGKPTQEHTEGWSVGLGKERYGSTCEDGSAYFAGLDSGIYRFELKDQPTSAVSVTIEDLEPHTITLVSG